MGKFGEKTRITLGRHFRGDVILSDPDVSRRHAAITREDHAQIIDLNKVRKIPFGTYYLKDLNSENGTYLNGTRLKPNQEYALNDGDQVQIGEHILTWRDAQAPRQVDEA